MGYEQKTVEEQKRISAERERLAQEYKKSPQYRKALAERQAGEKPITKKKPAWKERARKDIEERGYTIIAGAKFTKEEAEKILREQPIKKVGPPPERKIPEKPKTPAGMKEITFRTEEAMRYGLISRETARTQPETVTLYVRKDVSKGDLIRQAQQLKTKWFDIKRDRERAGKGYIPIRGWQSLEKKERTVAKKVGEHPLIRTSYVLSKDWLGIGTLHTYAVTKLTGGDWGKRQKEMLTGYGQELMVSQKQPIQKTIDIAGVPYQPIATAGMGVKIASFYLMGRSPAIGYGVKAVTSAMGGYEIGTGIRMIRETKGKATPEQARGIATHLASGFILTVPAQLSVYGKGIRALQKPKLEMRVAGTKEKFVYEKAGRITTTKSVAVEKINILQRKGISQRLHLRQPTKVGELYGQIKTVTRAGEVVGISKSKFAYAGKIHGKPIIIAGEEPSVSFYRATPETIHGYTYSAPRSYFKILGKPMGDTKAFTVSRFGGMKYIESPKAEYWTMRTRAGGIRETHQILQKQTRLHKFKDIFTNEQFVSRGKDITVFGKEIDRKAFLETVKIKGDLKEIKPFTKPTAPKGEIESIIKATKKIAPSIDIRPQTGMGAISGSKMKEQLGTGFEQIGLKGLMDFDLKYKTKETRLPAKGFQEAPSGNIFARALKQRTKILQTPMQKEMAKSKIGMGEKLAGIDKDFQKIAQSLGQVQTQRQAQKQRLGMKSMLSTSFFKGGSFRAFERFGTIPDVPSFGKMNLKDVTAFEEKGKKKKKLQIGKGKLGIKKLFFADLFSVTKSQLIFGKATHPALTEKEWGKAEKSFFINVPTVEMKKRGKNILKGII